MGESRYYTLLERVLYEICILAILITSIGDESIGNDEFANYTPISCQNATMKVYSPYFFRQFPILDFPES